jgi:hypothetical protein
MLLSKGNKWGYVTFQLLRGGEARRKNRRRRRVAWAAWAGKEIAQRACEWIGERKKKEKKDSSTSRFLYPRVDSHAPLPPQSRRFSFFHIATTLLLLRLPWYSPPFFLFPTLLLFSSSSSPVAASICYQFEGGRAMWFLLLLPYREVSPRKKEDLFSEGTGGRRGWPIDRGRNGFTRFMWRRDDALPLHATGLIAPPGRN